MRKIVLVLGLVLLLQLALVPASSAAPPESSGVWHTVRRGETLSSIGRMYGVKAYTICHANKLKDCNHIWYGQKLWIPSYHSPSPPHQRPPHPAPPHPGCTAYHTVSYGETLYGIGRHYGVNPWVIAHANGIYNMNKIYAGQKLCIPKR